MELENLQGRDRLQGLEDALSVSEPQVHTAPPKHHSELGVASSTAQCDPEQDKRK